MSNPNVSDNTILIADDDTNLVHALALRCRQLGLQVDEAYNALTALAKLDDNPADLICLDIDMPPGDGLSVCEMLATDQRFAFTPVIVLTGKANEDTIRRCHNLCAYYVQKCPDVWSRVEPLVCELLRVRPIQHTPPTEGRNASFSETSSPSAEYGLAATIIDRHMPSVLCIDDDPQFSLAVKLRLENEGATVLRAMDGTQGLHIALGAEVDAIILDFDMPNGRGDYILGRLRDNPLTKAVPVIVLTGNSGGELRRKMFNLGATNVLTKPVAHERLWDELQRHMEVVPCHFFKS